MKLAAFCLALIITALIVHLAWWRIRVPYRQIPMLLLIFMSALPLSAALAYVAPAIAAAVPGTAAEWFHVGLVYVPVSLAYIATYSAVEEDSPSLRIVRFVAQAGVSGRSRDDLTTILNDDVLVGSRLRAMVRDGLVVEEGGRYALTSRGRKLARVFTVSSAWLGIRAAG
jgi:hypothetical protein